MRPRAEMVNDVRPGWREGFGLSLAGLLLLAGSSGNAAVVINELSAAASSRQLSWSSNGVPRLGSGVAWMEPGFTPRGWSRGLLPAGYGFGGLATDLTEAMKDKAPSLYLRREFDLTAAEAAHTDPLVLWVDYNDGFVAYLNGIEVARAHCGPTNRFMFARQPAYNVNTSTLPAQIVLGPVSALLKPGRNVLALQVHNADLPGLTNWPERITLHQPTPEFKINVALRTSGATLVNLQVDRHDFDAATGARRIHTRTNGMVADTVLGSPMAGGWIANAAPPVSSPDWQGLELVTEEAVGAGPGGSGALRITVNQSGPNQAAAVHAPEVDLAPAWPVGAVASNHLANTYVRFRSRAAGGAQFRLRIDPAPGQEASALTGFPLIAPTNEAPVTFANAANGARTMTINAAGSQSQSVVGSLASLSLVAFASNDVRNMSYRIVEDGAAGAGYNASKGHLRAEITQAASAGSAWGFSYGNFGIGTWTPGSVTPQEMAYAEVQFACRIPVGVAFDVWVEPGSGGFSNRLDWGSITGTGGWEIVRRSFAGHPNTERFRLALNAARTRNVKLFFRASAALGAGTVLQLDDLQVIPWRQYEVRLADGTNGHAAFLGFLNGQGRVSFRPALEKVSDASGGPQTLTLDDYEVVYFGTNATAVTHYVAAGPAGGLWDYFVGLAEPSGGVFDPGLLAGGVMPTPAGAENEFENPEEFVDWIELFNNGGQAIDLSGWSLTDDRDKPGKWRFPSGTMLEAGAYLLVLCDDREEANAPAGPASDLHAGFSLDGDGEYVGLFDAQGVFVDGLTSGYPKQVFFASYGRAPGNPTEFGFLTTATPGAANQGEFFARRAAAPEFRQADGTNALPGGIYSSASLTLVLTNDTPGVSIRYTLDGSEPTEFNGLAYLGPLILTQTSDRTCAVVRARAFRPGWLPSGVRTHTYVLRQPAAFTNAPALFLSAQKDRAFYKPYGILAIEGGYFHTLSAPWDQMWIANSPTSYNEALGNGAPFEREVHLEYYFPPAYYPTNQQALRVDVGLRLSASPYQRPRMRLTAAEASSPFPPSDATEKPSFNIFFNGDYGPSKLDYKLFPNYDIKEFQHLRLRAGKNDNVNPFITDELVRRLWIDLGHVGPRGLFCPLYLNGVYKGIYNLTERVRESLFQAHLHSQLDWDVCYVGDWVNGDGLAYSNLVAALDRDLSVLSNYLAAAQLFHEDNFADYYLLNIYCAMWDWPENNYVFARERSAGPLGRFIFTVWDAEGAFNINSYYNKPTSHNTLTELATKSGDVPRLWQRLILSPEFRLRFADRIHRHCFNGGVLDDRDPDGAGPGLSHFLRRFNEVAAEAAPLVRYNAGTALNTNLFAQWILTNAGRRSYLLGTTAGRRHFRDAGLWPVTEPPVFSQHGGTVPPGYALTMASTVAATGQTATIYFTLDGTDPRLPGGALGPGALIYGAPVVISNVVVVKARARNDTTAEWSPLTEALFAPSAVSASASNLVIAEIMYHPPDATTNEVAAGFRDADEFEFLRLMNIGAVPLDLAGVRFSSGVTFDFNNGAVRYVNPGASVLVVKRHAAFRARYGSEVDALVAGEYTGNLSNGGERLALVRGASTLRDFSYGDGGAWPESPDGDGPSLLLRDPFSNPAHGLATNWMASAMPGGMPAGTPPSLTFARWQALFWDEAVTNAAVSGPEVDADLDGLVNFAEYALGLHPRRDQPGRRPQAGLIEIDGRSYLTLRFTTAAGAMEAEVALQWSSNVIDWNDAPPGVELLETTSGADGTTQWLYRTTAPLELTPAGFLRLQVRRRQGGD